MAFERSDFPRTLQAITLCGILQTLSQGFPVVRRHRQDPDLVSRRRDVGCIVSDSIGKTRGCRECLVTTVVGSSTSP